jgi:AsmA-like protein
MTRWTRHSVFWGLCGVLLVLAGAWLVLLPSRLAASIATTLEDGTGIGMAIAGSATLAFDDGPKIRFTRLRLADAKAPGSLKVELAEVMLPLSPSDMLGPPKIPHSARIDGAAFDLDLGVPLNLTPSPGKSSLQESGGEEMARYKINFSNSAFNLRDSKSGFALAFADADGVMESSATRPFLLHMSGLLNGIYTTLHIEADSAARILEGGSPADIVLSSDSGELRFSGRLGWNAASILALDGRLFAASRRTDSLLAWLGLPSALAPASAIELEGSFSSAGAQALLPEYSLQTNWASGKGKLSLAARPGGFAVDGALSAEKITLAQPGSSTAEDGWSSASFRWLPLAGAEGNFQVNAKSLVLRGWTLPDARLLFSFGKEEAELAVGASQDKTSFSASISRAYPPAFTFKAKLADAPAREVLSSLAGYPWLDGKIELDLDATAAGANTAALVSTLAGKLSFALTGGTVTGYSLKDLLSDSGKGWRAARADATTGVEVSTSCEMADGIITLGATRIGASDLDVDAGGEIDLLRQALDLRIDASRSKDLPKNMTISGSWHAPEFGVTTARKEQGQEPMPSQN